MDGLMDFSFSSLMAALVFSAAGLWLFREGKRRLNFRLIFIGMTLMVYSYFTRGPWADWGVGLALCGLAYACWTPVP